ncbi:MAG: cache domain-containing protein, partial [Bacillota bacterium]
MARLAMQLGVRGKLVGTLLLAGLLPLGLSLVAGVLAVQRVRMQFAGHSFRALAQQHAEHVSTLLMAQVDFFRLISQLPLSIRLLESSVAVPAPTADQIRAIESKWPSLGPNDPPLKEILSNELSQRWRFIKQQSPRIAEVIVTDRHGRLVAATNKTTDYYQADEAWWQACWANGQGKIILSEVAFDPSATSSDGRSGMLVVDLCLPIFAPNAAVGQTQPLGLLKISLEASWVLKELKGVATAQQGGMGSDVWLIGKDGRRITEPMGKPVELPEPLMQRIQSMRDGYIVGRAMAGRDVFGFAHVVFPSDQLEAPREWTVVVSGPLEAAMAPSQFMLWTLLLAGAGVMLGCFVAGFWIARQELIRP